MIPYWLIQFDLPFARNRSLPQRQSVHQRSLIYFSVIVLCTWSLVWTKDEFEKLDTNYFLVEVLNFFFYGSIFRKPPDLVHNVSIVLYLRHAGLSN
jgi:hypothetical protein